MCRQRNLLSGGCYVVGKRVGDRLLPIFDGRRDGIDRQGARYAHSGCARHRALFYFGGRRVSDYRAELRVRTVRGKSSAPVLPNVSTDGLQQGTRDTAKHERMPERFLHMDGSNGGLKQQRQAAAGELQHGLRPRESDDGRGRSVDGVLQHGPGGCTVHEVAGGSLRDERQLPSAGKGGNRAG